MYRDINGERVTGLMAELLEPLLGEPRRERRLQSQYRQMPVNDQIDAMSRRDERIRELNLPVTVQTVVENVIDLVTLTGKARAMAFLREQLRLSPLPTIEIERRAIEAGITKTALRRGRTALGIKPYQQQGTHESLAHDNSLDRPGACVAVGAGR